MTKHAAQRQAQRCISDLQLSLTLDYGQRVHMSCAEICFLGRKDIPDWIDPRYADKMDGTVVVLSPDGAVITTYRNPDYLHRLRTRAGSPKKPRAERGLS